MHIKHHGINKFVCGIQFIMYSICCILLVGCSESSGVALSNTPDRQDISPVVTRVPDQDYMYIFPVTEIDGIYYEFPGSQKIGIITTDDEQNIFPLLTEIGSTTRTDSPSEYPDKKLQSNCLPAGTSIFYNEQEDKFGLFYEEQKGYWCYSGVYKIYDKNEMSIGKNRISFEYTDHLRYSSGWIREEYKNATKVSGFVDSLSNEGLTVKSADIVDGTIACSGEILNYDCFHPDLFNLYEDSKHYVKSHLFTIEDVDLDTLYYFYIDAGKVVAVVEAAH